MGHKPDNRKKVKKRTITLSIPYCIVLAGLIFFSAVINPNNNNNNTGNVITAADAQSINKNNNNNNGNNSGTVYSVNGPYSDKAPTFLDAYWTNNPSGNSSSSLPITSPNSPPSKTEVGPGDNVATLAVVLVNRGRSDITGVTGYLDLPSDFRPIAGKNNGTSQSVAGYYSVVKAGSTFVLYFDMSVLKQAKVGGYSTSINIKYTKILEVGELMTRITVPFRLTGKVVLNTVAKNTELTPGMPNDIRINLQNIGTANATGVIITVRGVTGSGSVTNTAATTATTRANSNLSVTGASTGQQQPSSFSSIPAANLGSETFNVGTITANDTVEINPIVYPTASAGETAQNLNVQISYGDAYGNQKAVNPQVGFIITPNPPQSVLNVTSNNENALILTAGKIQNMSFTLANNDKRPITNVVATLSSQSSSLNILGDTRWTMQTMPAQSKLNLSTKVFASASIVTQPSLFTLTVQYISAGQSKLDSLNLGAYITGEIKIRVYDVSFNKIGNIPNLVGNILNEGNTVGLFTTVEIVKQTPSTPTKRSLSDFMTSVPPSQYLGDLDADSPLPFSIPLSIDNKTMARMPPGMYPVTLKITYSDDLKIPHQLILNNMVNFQPARQPSTAEHLNFFGFDIEAVSGGIGNNFVIIAIVAAIAIVTSYIIVRRSKAHKLKASQEEIVKEPFLDDFSSSSSSIEEGISSDDARKKKRST